MLQAATDFAIGTFVARVSQLPPPAVHSPATHAVQDGGYLATLGIQMSAVGAFLQRIEESYRPNPYHNFTHCVHVLQEAPQSRSNFVTACSIPRPPTCIHTANSRM